MNSSRFGSELDTVEVARAIVPHQDRIIARLGPEPIAVYCRLAFYFAAGDVRFDHVFQFLFRSFYRLDNAGLTADFKTRFFELMQEARECGRIDLKHVANELRAFRTLRGRKSLQFSFISKLAATVDASYPIYDKEVARVFGFCSPYGQGPYEERLAKLLNFYEQLRTLYPRLLADPQIIEFQTALKAQYPAAKHLPPAKLLDFIFWAAGKLRISVIRKRKRISRRDPRIARGRPISASPVADHRSSVAASPHARAPRPHGSD